MAELNMKLAIRTYNNIMYDLCKEHRSIGTDLSEHTDKWNLRDMVAECDYILSCYYEDGYSDYEMRYSEDKEARDQWRRESSRLQRFINKYAPLINDMKCSEGHCSKYD